MRDRACRLPAIGGAVLLLIAMAAAAEIVALDTGKERKDDVHSEWLIDDFESGGGMSPLGTEWGCFTDRVMGGVSEAAHGFDTIDGESCIRLQGKVSLENNGGFVQVALPLEPDGKAVDAGGYDGIRLRVRGNGEKYFVHLRTRDTRLPWQYYAAAFETEEAWQTVEILFEDFEPASLRKPLDSGSLKRVAIVAAKKAFEADVAVSRLAFFSDASAE